ncbi:hypothetical protein [Halorussus amylolyticus]|uniref:hypothetical protein n=1 Tax=Halorussus amylolyticus TaxID=1126242 RepID=UPI0010450425|nr:hypothetical protein [Halorussus amylolyticus]
MTDYTESDSFHVRGRIEGYLQGTANHTDEDTSFDPDTWTDLYGARVIYDSFPAWPSADAREQGEDPFTLCDWDEETQTLSLKQGVDLPRDRPGVVVFGDGTAVIARDGHARMFTLADSELAMIEELAELALEMLRDAYDYTSK